MRPTAGFNLVLLGLSVLVTSRTCATEPNRFDADPHWDGHRNRLVPDNLPATRQDFGYRTTRKAGGKDPGEIGGRVQRSVTPAYYAKSIAPVTLEDKLTASGRFAVHDDEIRWLNVSSQRIASEPSSPSSAERSIRPSSNSTSRAARPTAAASGLPPNVLP